VSDKQIDCEEALRRVFELIDHELDEHEREAMERHMQACKSCFSRADFERRLKARLGELRAAPPVSAAERIEKLLKSF
jgi:anti-sigma factor (TIGR02949 family)